MAKPTAPPAPRRSFRGFVFEGAKRIYTLGVIGLVAWLSYLALEYLIVALVFPTEVPEQIVGVPARFTEDVLRTRRSEWLGVETSENPRTPVAHYHRLNGWLTPDRANDCTRSGCHVPLPHAERKEVRAFLNLHSTSMHCSTCHFEAAEPIAAGWYDVQTGGPSSRPAVLELYAWLSSDDGQAALAEPTPAVQTRIAALLRTAAAAADGNDRLLTFAQHVEAVRYSSEAFQQIVARLQRVLPRHFRGEYGVKLTLKNEQGDLVLGHPDNDAAVEEFLTADELAPDRREELLDQVHTARRTKAVTCSDCHSREPSRLDFSAVGYPPSRVDGLMRPAIFRMIEHIAAGQPFYLPSFIEPEPEAEPEAEPESELQREPEPEPAPDSTTKAPVETPAAAPADAPGKTTNDAAKAAADAIESAASNAEPVP